jgi:hypothetical protein
MKKPTKTILVPHCRTFYFDHVSNKVSIDYFMDWIKETVPKGAVDVTIGMDEDYDYESGDLLSSNIVVSWKQKAKNTRYVSEMKKWKKQCQK